MELIAEHAAGWSDGTGWIVVDKDLEPCEDNYHGMIASGFMTEAKALDFIARLREHLIEMGRRNYGEKPRERQN